jgi:peptidoglycan/xylan/chitin deacetylase (PgdA/CDA1 family)
VPGLFIDTRGVSWHDGWQRGSQRRCWALHFIYAAAVIAPAGSALVARSAEAAINTCPTPKTYVLTTVPATYKKNVALTFDDGPSPKWTPQVLDILKANHVRATFFMIGQNARAYPSLVRRAVAEGHTIGNHSYSHPNLTTLSTTQQRASMDNAAKYISAAIGGGYKPCFFRPPYGRIRAPPLIWRAIAG